MLNKIVNIVKMTKPIAATFFLVMLVGFDMPASSTERAGVVLLKQYCENDWAILLGEKNGTTNEWKSVNFPAGIAQNGEKKDLRDAAIREMKEETGGPHSPLKNVTKDQLFTSYLESTNASSKIRLYFLDVTPLGNVGKDSLTKGVKAALNNPNLSGDYKEVSGYWAVAVQDIVKAAKRVKNGVNSAGKRRFESRGNNTQLQLESYYTQALADRVDGLCEILKKITGIDYSKA
ncbi:MAG: NUDIX hydrolase [Alphaproteobacteria bacterium]|jgi:8-oxo-dGTP pyrophosphatase MutT (NUDIX family)|nr:NUDIX hydrolase [Alphaproteobacteria bacterium]